MSGEIKIVQGSALDLKLRDNSVDLVVTSPPYFGLRSYKDNGEHYEGQIGSEATPAEFVDALIAATREMVRVLKPSGSIWVNLGDRYTGKAPGPQGETGQRADRSSANEPAKARRGERPRRARLEQFTREDAAWLAGVIDSDGSIGVHINQQPEGRAPSFVPWVRVGQMRSEVVTRIEDVVGTGRVMQDGRGVWHWSASAQQARWVLERVHPWLLIKKRQAWAAIEVARHVEERNARGSHRPLTADDIDYRHGLRNAVMAWNRGDDYDLDPPEPPAVSLPIHPLAPRDKSLIGIPWRYATRCIDDLGLILRAEVIWSKTNGMPESVTDRVRRSHETWFHFTKEPRYFSAVDEIREEHAPQSIARTARNRFAPDLSQDGIGAPNTLDPTQACNPLGKLPGSVWTIPTQPLRVPDHISHARCCGGVKRDGCKDGINHFAAFPMEWPKRIIKGWCPPGGIVLDPFGGTGTTALVASVLGMRAISVDLSADYCSIARWRTTDPKQIERARR